MFSSAALVYECAKTIATIYPKPALLEAAASSISKFITSKRHSILPFCPQVSLERL